MAAYLLLQQPTGLLEINDKLAEALKVWPSVCVDGVWIIDFPLTARELAAELKRTLETPLEGITIAEITPSWVFVNQPMIQEALRVLGYRFPSQEYLTTKSSVAEH